MVSVKRPIWEDTGFSEDAIEIMIAQDKYIDHLESRLAEIAEKSESIIVNCVEGVEFITRCQLAEFVLKDAKEINTLAKGE
jgi:hypothetical protein